MSDPTQPAPARKGRGCLFYGCLTCVVFLLIAGLGVFFTARYVKNQFNAFTEAAPATLPKVQVSDAEFDELQNRLKAFSDAMQQGQPAEALVLTERDINAFIAKSPEAKEIADKVYVSLKGDELKGQVSIPLSQLRWIGKGRYLNGEATFKVSLENDELVVNITDIQVKGKPLPESFMTGVRNENWAREAANNPKHAQTIKKFESIQVRDSRVTVKAKSP